jgi:hypothetical protein
MKTKQKLDIRKLSLSLPGELKPLVKERAAQLDLTVSQYIRRLVNDEINVEALNITES